MGRGKMLAAGAVGAGVLGAGALAYRHFHRQEKQASVANISEFIEKVASDVSFVDEMEKISKDVKRKEEDISHMNFFERHPKKILGGAAAGLIGGIALHRMLKGGKAKIPMAPHPPGPTMKRAPSSAPHNTSGEALKPGSSIKPNPEGLKQWRKAHRAAQVGKIKTLPEATGLFKLDHSKSSRSGSDRDSFKRSRMWRSKYKGAIKNLLPEATPETRKANSARQQKLNKRKWVEEAKNVEMDRLAEQVGRRLAERKGK